MTIKVLIADDHGVVAEGLRFVVEAQADMEVTACVRSRIVTMPSPGLRLETGVAAASSPTPSSDTDKMNWLSECSSVTSTRLA